MITSDALDDATVTLSGSFGLTTLPCVAVISVVPTATPVANPPAATIVANNVFEEAHVTLLVIFLVELSLYVPVAVTCTVFPIPTLGAAGSTATDCTAAVVPVTVTIPPMLVILPPELLTATTNSLP